jgi:hypothetical protein
VADVFVVVVVVAAAAASQVARTDSSKRWPKEREARLLTTAADRAKTVQLRHFPHHSFLPRAHKVDSSSLFVQFPDDGERQPPTEENVRCVSGLDRPLLATARASSYPSNLKRENRKSVNAHKQR